MNYFEYQDYPKIDRSQVVITTNLELQTGSSIEQLKEGVKPYDYASFEKDAYITSEPKKLAPLHPMLGLISKEVSDSYGYISPSPRIEIKLNDYYSFSGITIGLVNNINTISVRYADISGATIKSKSFSPKSKLEFLDFPAESVARIYIELLSTKPYHFVGVYQIELGRTVIFDATNLVDANITTHFDVDGSTIQYDVAELTIFTGENDSEYLFQKKQPIVYKDTDGKTLHKFYIENGENNDAGTSVLTAYDSISLLEDEYLGGIYGFIVKKDIVESPLITYQALVDDILSDTGIDYEISDNIKDVLLFGYIPICTRRKALATILKGTNTRIFKTGGKLIFKHINDANEISLTENNIAENPSIETSTKISKLTVLSHNYQKDTEIVDLYNWYLQQGDNTMQMIKFSQPVYKIQAYEVVDIDENGNDILSKSQSTSVNFYQAPIFGGIEEGDDNVCNYCIIKSCHTSNKVVIKGWKILDDTEGMAYFQRTDIDSNADYEEIIVDDVTIIDIGGDVGEVAKVLYALETQNKTQEFMVVETELPIVGSNINTPMVQSPISANAYDIRGDIKEITHNVKILEVEDNLSGVYRVVAK